MFSNPQTIVSQLTLAPGSTVADLGAGTGAFSFPLAAKVGPTGKVYACEVQADIMSRLESEIRDHGTTNIIPVHANIELLQGTRLRDASVDWVVLANVLFQVEDRDTCLEEIKRILKPEGAVLLIDWTESFGNLGPHTDHVINQSAAETLFTKHGLRMTPAVIDGGSHHYAVVFKK